MGAKIARISCARDGCFDHELLSFLYGRELRSLALAKVLFIRPQLPYSC